LDKILVVSTIGHVVPQADIVLYAAEDGWVSDLKHSLSTTTLAEINITSNFPFFVNPVYQKFPITL